MSMLKILSILLIFGSAESVLGKTPSPTCTGCELLDALKIDSLIQSNNLKEVDSIYMHYGPHGMGSLGGSRFDLFIKNKRGWNAENKRSAENLGAAQAMTVASPATSFLSAPVIASGVAEFVIERAKEELYMAFFKYLNSKLEDPNYAALKALFPQTEGQLKVMGDEIFNFSIYLQNLREAFNHDLDNLATDLRIAVQKKPLSDFFKNYPGLLVLLKTGIYVAEELKDHAHPGDMIQNLDITDFNSIDKTGALKRTLFCVKLINHSFHGTDSGSYWVTTDRIQPMLKDSIAFAAYFSLLELSANNQATQLNDSAIMEFARNEIPKTLDLVYGKTSDASNCFLAFGERIKTVEGCVHTIALKDKKAQTVSIQDYSAMFTAANDLLELPTEEEVQGLIGCDANSTVISDYRRVTELMNSGGSLYLDLANKSYASAISEVSIMLDNLFPKNDDVLIQFLKIGSFAAAVVESKNSDDVDQALEAAALPVGSYMIKRKNNPSVMINAFFGPYFGYEKIGDQQTWYPSGSWGPAVYGLSLPVGFSFNICGGSIGSLSIFASVLDLSALGTLRSTGDTTKSLPNFTWQNILGLGGYLSLGIAELPICLNAGLQFGPALETITPTGANLRQQNYGRWSVSIVVDVPIVNLYAAPD